MKILIITIAYLVLTGCGKANTGNDIKDDSVADSSIVISQRHLHEKTYEGFHFSSEQEWDSLNQITPNKINHQKGTVHPDVRTFGWHLYSNGSAWQNYNFSMLWGIAYFSYAVDPETGSYKSIHEWKNTGMIDSAKAAQCKVFLSVSNFGSSGNATFLENPVAQHT